MTSFDFPEMSVTALWIVFDRARRAVLDRGERFKASVTFGMEKPFDLNVRTEEDLYLLDRAIVEFKKYGKERLSFYL